MKRFSILFLLLLTIGGCKKEQSVARDVVPEETMTAGTTTISTSAGETADAAAVGPQGLAQQLAGYQANSLDGRPVTLASMRGKVVLLNVWATWCGPCRAEMPELQRLHDSNKGKGLEVLGVSIDQSGVEAVRTFLQDNPYTYPIVLDEQGRIAELMQTTVIPTSALLDRKGNVVWFAYGMVNLEDPELKAAIAKAL